MKNKYSILINGSDFAHSWADVATLSEAKKLASEIAKIGCFWLNDVELLSDDLIHNRITIDVYCADDLKFTIKLSKRLRLEYLEKGIKRGWYSPLVVEEFKLYNS